MRQLNPKWFVKYAEWHIKGTECFAWCKQQLHSGRNLARENLARVNLAKWLNAGYWKSLAASPAVQRAIALMDAAIGFMGRPQHRSGNPALNFVRAPLVVGLWCILALTLVMLVWGALVPIESATVAKGKVVLLSNKKTIQHLEGGIIEDIHVKEGDKVVAGQPLLRLSDTAAAANLSIVQGQLYAARAAESRLLAERNKLDRIVFGEDMSENAKSNADIANAIEAQVHIFESEREGQHAKRAIFDQRIAQSRDTITGLQSQITGLTGQLDILDEEIASIKELLTKGYATKTRLFELQRSQSELQGTRGQHEADIAKAKQNIAETEMQIIDQEKEFETKNSQDLRDTQAEIIDLQDKLRAARDIAERTVITAPTSGIVNGLKYHTKGGVIAGGTPIMDIIPQDDQLIVEVHVQPNDISVVHAGQDARVMFTSYKMRTTPKVPGKVTQVSADTFTDERVQAAAPYYIAKVEVDKDFLKHIDEHIEMYPGMPAEVLMRTGSRSFLGYLFSPITDSMRVAFREE